MATQVGLQTSYLRSGGPNLHFIQMHDDDALDFIEKLPKHLKCSKREKRAWNSLYRTPIEPYDPTSNQIYNEWELENFPAPMRW